MLFKRNNISILKLLVGQLFVSSLLMGGAAVASAEAPPDIEPSAADGAAAPSPKTCAAQWGYLIPGQAACLYSQNLSWRADGYAIRVEWKPKSKTYDRVLRSAQTAATQLSSATGVSFRVGAAFPAGSDPQPGEIVLRPDTYSPLCGSGIACANGQRGGVASWPWVTDNDRIDGGQVFFRSDFGGLAAATQLVVIEHEIGHVLGLLHYDRVGGQEKINGKTVPPQIMDWNVRGVTPTLGGFQSGDVAGLRAVADFRRKNPRVDSYNLTPITNAFVVNGSGSDPSDMNRGLRLRISVDGAPSVNVGFGQEVSATPGNHNVCATALNAGAGVDVDLGCQNITVRSLISAFVVDGNAQVATRNWDAKSGWSPWWTLLSGTPIVGTPVVVGNSTKGRIDVFARNSANQLIQSFWTPQSGWTQWFNLGGTITSDPAVFYDAPNNDYFVYARGANGQLVQRLWNNDWSPWYDLGGQFEGTPAVIGQSGSVQNVFVRNSANQLWQTVWTPNSGWSPWYNLGGSIASDPTVIFDVSANDVHIFARGTNGHLVQKFWNDNWSQWIDLGGVIEGKPSIAGLPSQGALQVFARNGANQLWQTVWTNQSGWSPWYNLGGSISSDPTVIFDPNTRETQVYARGTAGNLAEIVWLNGWSPWYDIGGWLLPNSRPSIVW